MQFPAIAGIQAGEGWIGQMGGRRVASKSLNRRLLQKWQ
jgi:hypothetical protein